MGPLVVAGVACEDPDLLWEMGCKDSKKLTPARRQRLARLLEDDPHIRVEVRIVEAATLDDEMAVRTLNEVEMLRFQEIAAALHVKRLVVDAADVDAARFGRRVQQAVPGAVVVSEHRADGAHATVAAASIIAKSTRDRLMEDLARRLERRLDLELGSGYPSDPKTQRFLGAWLDRFGDLPEGTRTRWKTVERLLAAREAPRPTRLGDFA